MSKKNSTKFVTRDILKSSLEGAFQKLDPRYMIKNPVMFVVEAGCLVTLLLTVFPTLFGGKTEYQLYNGIVTGILFITVLFANFAESVAEGRGKAQAASLKKNKTGYKGQTPPFRWQRKDSQRLGTKKGRSGAGKDRRSDPQ